MSELQSSGSISALKHHSFPTVLCVFISLPFLIMENIEVIDLGDPMTLRQLAVDDGAPPTPFISEFSATLNKDSGIEDEEPDDIAVRRGQPIFRQTLGVDEDEDDDNDNGSRVAPLWSKGTTAPQNPPFTGKSGLLVEMDDTTPLAFLKLMV